MSLVLIVLLPFIGALFPALMIRSGRSVCAISTLAFTLLAFALLMSHVPAVFRGEIVTASWDWLPALGLQASFFLDGLGLFFAGLILGIGMLIIVYARFYLAKDDPMGVFYTYLLLFQGAMVGVVLSDNILLLLVFWELTSLSSFLLIGYWKHLPEGRQGARMALTVTGAGGLAMIEHVQFVEPSPDVAGALAGEHDVLLSTGPEGENGFDPRLLRAMGCGMAVVTYDDPATVRLLEQNAAAIIVPRGNVLLLAQAVIDLQQNRRRLIELAENAWRFAASRTLEAAHRRRAELAMALLGQTTPTAR